MAGANNLKRLSALYTGRPVVVTGGEGSFGQALQAAIKSFGGVPISVDLRKGTAGSDHFFGCDIRDATAFAETLAAIDSAHGIIGCVIANAAIDITAEAHQLTPEDWRKIIETNLIGTTNLIALTYPAMQAQRSGDILIASSGSSLISFPFGLPYTSSKAAQLALSLGLRSEAKRYGVNVSCAVLPSLTTDGESLSEVSAEPKAGLDRSGFLNALPGKPFDMNMAAMKALRGLDRRKGRIIFPMALAFIARLVGLFPGFGAALRDDVAKRFEHYGQAK